MKVYLFHFSILNPLDHCLCLFLHIPQKSRLFPHNDLPAACMQVCTLMDGLGGKSKKLRRVNLVNVSKGTKGLSKYHIDLMIVCRTRTSQDIFQDLSGHSNTFDNVSHRKVRLFFSSQVCLFPIA